MKCDRGLLQPRRPTRATPPTSRLRSPQRRMAPVQYETRSATRMCSSSSPMRNQLRMRLLRILGPQRPQRTPPANRRDQSSRRTRRLRRRHLASLRPHRWILVELMASTFPLIPLMIPSQNLTMMITQSRMRKSVVVDEGQGKRMTERERRRHFESKKHAADRKSSPSNRALLQTKTLTQP